MLTVNGGGVNPYDEPECKIYIFFYLSLLTSWQGGTSEKMTGETPKVRSNKRKPREKKEKKKENTRKKRKKGKKREKEREKR